MLLERIDWMIPGPATQWSSRGRPTADRLRRAARRIGDLLLSLFVLMLCGTALLSILAIVYSVKRALGIDVFPGVDVLPDEAIEAFLWGSGR